MNQLSAPIIDISDPAADQKGYWTDQRRYSGTRDASPAITPAPNTVYAEEVFGELDAHWVDPWNGFDPGHARLSERHKATLGIGIICALGLISSILPPLAQVLTICLGIAVIAAGVAFVVVFTYLIGTSVRTAWYDRQEPPR